MIYDSRWLCIVFLVGCGFVIFHGVVFATTADNGDNVISASGRLTMSTPNPKRLLMAIITILGFTLAACGLWMAGSALVQAFNPPSYAEMLGRAELPPTVRMLLDSMQLEGSALMKQIVSTFVMNGLLPLFLGVYLVRAGGLLRRFSADGGPHSTLGRYFLPRMSFALARIEEDMERGYQPFRLGKP
jgi:hypothetical protein